MHPPTVGDTWVALTHDVLSVDAVYTWAVRPDCGAVVAFSGTARDHSEGRPDVTLLEYEAYEEEVEPRLRAVADEARKRWPSVGRLAVVHRVGPIPIGDSSVLVVVSSPHRDEAFSAARFGIDTLKATVPIWKREHWEGGSDWARQCTEVADVAEVHP